MRGQVGGWLYIVSGIELVGLGSTRHGQEGRIGRGGQTSREWGQIGGEQGHTRGGTESD